MIQHISSYMKSLYSMYFRIIYRGFQAYWFLFYSMVISTLIYVSFYQLYLPQQQHDKLLYFHYESNCERKVGDGLCSFPKASVLLHDSFERYQDGTRVLTRGQSYDMSLELELPLTRSNKHIGMFMTQIDLISKDNLVITSTSRSTMMLAQDSLVASLRTLLKVVPLFLGIMEEKEWLVVPLLDKYIDESYNPAVKVNVTVMSKHLHFYSAKLKIVAQFHGMRYYMHNWPVLFSMVGFCIVLFIVSAISLLRVTHKSSQYNSNTTYDYSNLNSASVAEDTNMGDSRQKIDENEEDEYQNLSENEDLMF